MKIDYHPTKLKISLVFGIIWLVLSMILLKAETIIWTTYAQLVLACFSLFMYNFCKRTGYLDVKEGFIYIKGLIKKKIKISDIKRIHKYNGKYILSTEASNFEINTYLMDASGLEMLNQFLKDSEIH